MDRENFYLLLELNLDPPETDPKKIDSAISRMRATWSRFRNHPSKGIQAKKYIGMIAEIRRVMKDPQLRNREAKEAVAILKRRKRKKYAQVDRHLKLRLSKGFITDQEIEKLASMHELEEETIRERIKDLEAERISAVNEDIQIRMAKGYVTESDIASIAKRHGINPSEIKKRITTPIRKDSEGATEKIQRLDRSIAKNISNNLKIVGKKNLYDFLGATPTASNKQLVTIAKKKELEIWTSWILPG
jgi:polyhydroxyalkanoate synthesis regulator phasin